MFSIVICGRNLEGPNGGQRGLAEQRPSFGRVLETCGSGAL